ncbi:MAG: Zn-dependent hydrolase [Sedimentibacter sp.]
MNTNIKRIQQDIEELSKFTATPGNGTTRLSFSNEDRGAREYIKNQMVKGGLSVYEDAAGTIVGRIEGELKNSPIVLIGSHFDTVLNGGNFDGLAGIVAALETARVLQENKLKPRYPVEFIAMIEEEGTRFGAGLFASRAMAGKVSRQELYESKDASGIVMAQAMETFGFDPDKIEEAIRPKESLKAYLELHIEQGPILEAENKEVGVVEYIVGLHAIEVKINGRADHAGTTPMNMRSDAMEAAAMLISRVGDYAREVGEGSVATVGRLSLLPGSVNVVPKEVTFTVDIRAKDSNNIKSILQWIYTELDKISESKNVTYEVQTLLDVQPVKLSEEITNIIENNCNRIGFSNMRILSGAGHDAMVMVDLTPTGMIFVPSKNGRSHSPSEWTDYELLHKGIEIAFETIKIIAEA